MRANPIETWLLAASLALLVGCPTGDAGFDRVDRAPPPEPRLEGRFEDPGLQPPELPGVPGDPPDDDDVADAIVPDLCEPGDMVDLAWGQGEAWVALSDAQCPGWQASDPPAPDDFAARFLLVLLNPGQEQAGLTIAHSDAAPSAAPPPALAPALVRPAPAPRPAPPSPPPPDCEPDVGPADLGGDARTFHLPGGPEPGAPRETRGATLQALGARVAIYVDDATPIDFDPDCDDPTNPVLPGELPAFGFDNCQLQQVADVLDGSLLARVEALVGPIPDIDCDCLLTVFVSHRLNGMGGQQPLGLEATGRVRSFAEPSIDFWEADLETNPGSNERDIVFVYAPDPASLWHTEAVPLDRYLGFELLGQLGDAVARLAMYAAGVGLEAGCPDALGNPDLECSGSGADGPLADWLEDGIAQLAADQAGFGAAFHDDAWAWLDRSHLVSLTRADTPEQRANRAGSWLVARYLAEVYGPGVAQALLAAGGSEAAIEAVTGQSLDAFLLDWATSVALTGVVGPDGGPLVAPELLTPFPEPGLAAVTDPEAPAEGELWGAAGYQLGFDVHGLNVSRSGGADPNGPTVEAELLTENLDRLLFHPQTDFFTTLASHHGVAAVLVDGLEQPVNALRLETADDGELVGRVIRLPDVSPHAPTTTLEDVDGPLITTVRDLSPIDWFGEPRHVIGRIDPDEPVEVIASGDDDDSAGSESWELPVPDIDRYLLSVPATAHVAVQVERRTADLDGGVPLSDPFVVITTAEAVPDVADGAAWNLGPGAPCASADVYAWPQVVPEFVAWQGVLTRELGPVPAAVPQDLHSGSYDCEEDLDADGTPDWREREPETLPQQLASWLDEQGGCVGCTPWAWVDPDSAANQATGPTTTWTELALGGQAQPDGAEAAWHGWMPPGDWMLLVGATDGTGPYELTVRLLP